MVERTLSDESMGAGAAYVDAVRSLGLETKFAAWAWDKQVGDFVLVIVSDFVDLVGPLEVSKRLFTAFIASATPAELIPFVVRLHSPRQAWFVGLRTLLSKPFTTSEFKPDPGSKVWKGMDPDALVHIEEDGVAFYPDWVIQYATDVRVSKMPLARRWHQFDNKVTSLAA